MEGQPASKHARPVPKLLESLPKKVRWLWRGCIANFAFRIRYTIKLSGLIIVESSSTFD
jgi:hypothetical protein